MAFSGIYALANQSVINSAGTGIVDIKLQTYKLNDINEETLYGNEKTDVMPGQIISLIPKVTNLAEDCYIRFKAFYIKDSVDISSYVTDLSTDFEKHGDYYYYKNIFEKDNKINLFSTIKIPENVDELILSNEFVLTITVEAIQSKNFEPDYSLADPWNGVPVTECVNESYNIDSEDLSKIILEFDNDTQKDFDVPSDFLKSLHFMMPGDTLRETIDFKDTDKKNAKYYLQINLDEQLDKEKDLLSKIDLIIRNKSGEIIYNGKADPDGKILLGNYQIGDDDKFTFEIHLPTDLSNEYTMLNPEMTFVFTADYENDEDKPGSPKTGDNIYVTITIFFISAIGLVITIIYGYRLRDKDIDSK
jgi:hypothetical protein